MLIRGGKINQRFFVHSSIIVVFIIIAIEIMFFGGLISTFIITKINAVIWPPPGQPRLPIEVTGINSIILLASLFTFRYSIKLISIQKKRSIIFLIITIFLGLLFLIIQGYEWINLLEFRFTIRSTIHSAFFYIIVGAHAFHVIAGIIMLKIVLFFLYKDKYNSHYYYPIIACQFYWTFVVVLWPFLYYLVYF